MKHLRSKFTIGRRRKNNKEAKQREKGSQAIVEKAGPTTAGLVSVMEAGDAAAGKKSTQNEWINQHKLGLLISIGMLWGMANIIVYCKPGTKISNFISGVIAFLPMVLALTAFIYYLLFPLIRKKCGSDKNKN